ncbi:hypothetical protein QR680_009551 [Steinernema hermaphroditum]|uniref:Domain of unknown function DB domain-containing protein n=1 Tax=Steinernema hermaphroditum TaxID=289476 RepID=A0AA39M9X9_9BILA|nr:hypothetical protein QR680_009551 [Steinernema hermaphroditum]
MLPEPQSPRTALALTDLQTSTGGLGGFSVGGGGFNSNGGVNSWTTRGVGGAGGLLDQKPSGGFFGSSSSSSNQIKRLPGGQRRPKFLQRLLLLGSLRLQQLRLLKWIISEMSPLRPYSSFKLSVALVLVAFTLSVHCSSDNLPSCDSIPKLLCCTERVMEKCLSGCVDYVSSKCPHKLEKFEKIAPAAADSNAVDSVDASRREVKPTKAQNAPYAGVPEETRAAVQEPPKKARVHGVGAVDGVVHGPAHSDEGFIEQPSPSGTASRPLSSSAPSRSGGDYDLVRSQYPITEVSDADLTGECGTERSKPPFSPCLSRKNVDDLFLSCCQQHVPSNCHSICQYEHREHVAAETLISAVQNDGCDLKYLSKVLYCANQNRDNRQCCRTLGLAGSELGVGDRCLRMCNIARSGDRVGTIEKNDLVCLSNWNVVMYCARAGIRTIN